MDNKPRDIPISDYDYGLPPERIAPFPLPDRSSSKLLVYDKGHIRDDHFYHLPEYLDSDTVLILNDTRVLPARIFFQKSTGGQIEIFLLEPFGQSMEEALTSTASAAWHCLIGGASKWKPGQLLHKDLEVEGQTPVLTAAYQQKLEDGFVVDLSWSGGVAFTSILQAAGAIPLPPYIKRQPTAEDAERYQTVFSEHEGSVAAPTAALHLTPEILDELHSKGCRTGFVTLHVGAGTFKPVKASTLGGHHMHREPFSVSLQTIEDLLSAQKVVAVGTTSLRTLESLHWLGVKLMKGKLQEWTLGQWEAYELEEACPETSAQQSLQALADWMKEKNTNTLSCTTSLLIAPGYRFKIPSGLITNFHQPQSTLLLLISAFIGDDWKKIYDHALQHDYRFLSYGDSSLLWRKSQ